MAKRTLKNYKKYVVDTSICAADFFEMVFDNLYKNLNNDKIILTSAVLKELDNLQKFNDVSAKNAKYLMRVAALDEFHFKAVKIDETLPLMDDCIIAFCMKDVDNVVLLTSDKYMTLKARMHGIQVQYYEHYIAGIEHDRSGIVTLVGSVIENDRLVLYNGFHRQIKIIRGGNELCEEDHQPIELKMGDEIFLATKKEDYFTFAHYEVISLKEKDNCFIVFSKRIYSKKDISKMSKPEYKIFIRHFIRNAGKNLNVI